MQQIITKRKAAWVGKRKPDVILGMPLNPNVSVEIRYYQGMARLIEEMTEETHRKLERLFNSDPADDYFGEDASITSQARILTNALQRKFIRLFATSATRMAEQMAKQSDRVSRSQLHESLKQLTGGLSLPTTSLTTGPLKEILSAGIAENVALIKSIPVKYLSGVQGAVMRSITTGNGLQDLVPYLARGKGVTLRRARFIAKDQTKKVFESLARGQAQALGIKKGKWLHTGGSNHPRKTHIAMTGKIFDLAEGLYDSDAKEFVAPGQLPGCRCRFIPVIEFKQ